ncbi:MAG: helix-turn-helix domain-containing protein [Micromonosporaceae bacterium]
MSLEEPARPDQARLSDAKTLRALSHPVRLALMEVLVTSGPLTATEAGELIGESPTTCSFHLRQLAKYGFVEEAGGGRGRQRPWRRTHLGWSVDKQHNPQFELASQALDRVLLERYWQRVSRWVETFPSYPQKWKEASDLSQYGFFLTAEELAELTADYHEVMRRHFERFKERYNDPSKRPPGARAVEVLTFAYPAEFPGIEPPGDEESDDQRTGDQEG